MPSGGQGNLGQGLPSSIRSVDPWQMVFPPPPLGLLVRPSAMDPRGADLLQHNDPWQAARTAMMPSYPPPPPPPAVAATGAGRISSGMDALQDWLSLVGAPVLQPPPPPPAPTTTTSSSRPAADNTPTLVLPEPPAAGVTAAEIGTPRDRSRSPAFGTPNTTNSLDLLELDLEDAN